ncbi:YebG family protein [Paraferrimonas sp. SM1919]|uniref:YebG family protein n=1 Tax=Paraferrimonas sp. SM1919 TaxID=2662263 RepID=UPI0013D125E6|nr:YebG family protein [Paraferrimonas sp. SM1919]
MAVEVIYRVVKRNGDTAGEYMEKKLADAYDQRLDCMYSIVDLIAKADDSIAEDISEKIADVFIENRNELMAALKKVKDIPAS